MVWSLAPTRGAAHDSRILRYASHMAQLHAHLSPLSTTLQGGAWRGTPIDYPLNALCGELLSIIMDFEVNQRTDGVFLYRMHDDLWSQAALCAKAWKEMNLRML